MFSYVNVTKCDNGVAHIEFVVPTSYCEHIFIVSSHTLVEKLIANYMSLFKP